MLSRLVMTIALVGAVSANIYAQSAHVGNGQQYSTISEGVNLFTGQLEYRLPLITASARQGKANSTFIAPIHNIHWSVGVEHWIHPNGTVYYYYHPAPTTVAPYKGYQFGPGTLEGDSSLVEIINETSISNFRFMASDGSSYQLLDAKTGGQYNQDPCFVPSQTLPPNLPSQCSRGRVFRTYDGSFVTYISDAEVYDAFYWPPYPTTYPIPVGMPPLTGFMIMKDGTRYRIEEGRVVYVQDTNGNRTTFTYYSSQQVPYGSLSKITDSLNREIIFAYGDRLQNSYTDTITYSGFAEGTRQTRVSYNQLQQALIPGQSIQTWCSLFPALNCTSSPHNPTVVTAVTLPNNKQIQLRYNSYAELARVTSPLGSHVDYEYSGVASTGADATGVVMPPYPGVAPLIYRHVTQVKKYVSSGQLSGTTTFDDVGECNPVILDNLSSSGAHLSREKHFFHKGSAINDFTWKRGREYKLEVYDSANLQTPLRTMETTWEQGSHFAWWTYGLNTEPQYDPRPAEIKTTLDTNEVTKQSITYDQYNNPTDVRIYNYGQGTPSINPIQRKHVEYLTVNPVNGINYAGPANGTSYVQTDPHILGLIRLQQLFSVDPQSGVETLAAQTETRYDEGSPINYGVTIPGWTNPGTARGNATTLRAWLDTDNTWVESTSSYDQVGNAVTVTDQLDNQTTISFADSYSDGNNSRNTYAHATRITTAAPDPTGVQGSSSPLITNWVYDFSTGLTTSETDSNDQTSTIEYDDSLDRPTRYVPPDGGGPTTVQYSDEASNVFIKLQTAIDASHLLEEYTFSDGFGRTTRQARNEGGSWMMVDKSYDYLNRPTRETIPFRVAGLSDATPVNVWTEIVMDALGRVTHMATPDGAQSIQVYNGLRILSSDPSGRKKVLRLNALQQLMDCWEIKAADQYTEPISFPGHPEVTAGYRTSYTHDALNNLRTVLQGQQNRTIVFDSLGRVISAVNPESGTMTFQYDQKGNLTQQTDARNVVTNMSYDKLNRLINRSYSDGTPSVALYYDNSNVTNSRGRLTEVASSISVYRSTSYDSLGRITGSEQVTGGQSYAMSYAYNLNGDLVSETYPSGRVVNTFLDNLGRASAVSSKSRTSAFKSFASGLGYAPSGEIIRMQLGNGKWEHTILNSRSQPLEIGLGTTPQESNLLKLNYTYGEKINGLLDLTRNNGNLESQSIVVPGMPYPLSQSYDYDALNRINTAKELVNGVQQWKQAFSYDQYGNRGIAVEETTDPLEGPNPLFSSTTNRVVPRPNEHYEYDLAGNLVRDKEGNKFGYDAEHRQTKFYTAADQTTPLVQNFYDGEGRRVKKVTGSEITIYVYNAAAQLIAEYSTVAPVQPRTSFLTTDPLGTPRAILNGNGAVQSRHDYLPFGEEIIGYSGRNTHAEYQADNVRQRFTGLEEDSEVASHITLYRAKARSLASSYGRFLTPDPRGDSVKLIEPQSFNRYSYALNNPYKYTDRSGESPTVVWYWDEATQLYFCVLLSETDKINEYDANPRYRRVNNYGPQGETFRLGKLTPNYDTPHNRRLVGYVVYLGADGQFHEWTPEGFDSPFANPNGPDPMGPTVVWLANSVRWPDAIQVSWGLLFFGQTYTYDAYGQSYGSNVLPDVYPRRPLSGRLGKWGLPKVNFRFGASISAVWIGQAATPSREQSRDAFTGPNITIQGGLKGVGGQFSVSPATGTTTTGFGLSTPGAGGVISHSTQGPDHSFAWR